MASMFAKFISAVFKKFDAAMHPMMKVTTGQTNTATNPTRASAQPELGPVDVNLVETPVPESLKFAIVLEAVVGTSPGVSPPTFNVKIDSLQLIPATPGSQSFLDEVTPEISKTTMSILCSAASKYVLNMNVPMRTVDVNTDTNAEIISQPSNKRLLN